MAATSSLTQNTTSMIPTQGQVDWVGLGKNSMTCTLEIASRIMHNELDACTLLVGRGACSSFSFPTAGQELLYNSLARLRGIHSFQKALWFGFGLKSIVHLLKETEEGAFCVALSAALAVPYPDSYDAAHVWHQYCLLRGTPTEFRPSIHQWKYLVNTCAGSLNHSDFTYHYDHFARHLAPKSVWRLPAPPREVALGLATLADLSCKKIHSAVFVGKSECAWLAAVARCLLRLSIEIQDASGNLIYKGTDGGDDVVHAIFRPDMLSPTGSDASTMSLVQRICSITSGEELLHERIDFTTAAVRDRSGWDKIFSDSFSIWDHFREEPTATYFKELAVLVASLSEDYYSSPSEFRESTTRLPWWLTWGPQAKCLFHPRLTGVELLKYGTKVFPELKDLFGSFQALTGLNRGGKQIVKKMEKSLGLISAHCMCHRCSRKRQAYSTTSDECSARLAMTLIRIILMLAPAAVQTTIPPSTFAFRQIYNCTVETGASCRGQSIPTSSIELILYLFTGQILSKGSARQDKLAVCASTAGICVYYSVLRDLRTLDLSTTTDIEMISGQIKYHERTYSFITDTEASEDNMIQRRKAMIDTLSTTVEHEDQLLLKLIVEEMKERELLSVTYQADLDRSHTVNICIAELQNRLTSSIYFHFCPQPSCSNILLHDGLQFQWSSFKNTTRSNNLIAEFDEHLVLPFQSWLLVDWSSWRLKGSSNNIPVRYLQFKVYQGKFQWIFPILAATSRAIEVHRSIESVSGITLLRATRSANCIIRSLLSEMLLRLPAKEGEKMRLELTHQGLNQNFTGRELILDVSVASVQHHARSQHWLLSLFGH